MLRTLISVSAAALLICAMTAAHAGKVTLDPNARKQSPAKSVSANADKRLEKRVTYLSTDKRLSTVLDELSKATGVPLHCGKNKDNWQVRDLPVVVCASDIPLGKLLNMIADSTHLLLSAFDAKGVRGYRIWRDAKREKDLRAYFDDQNKVGQERVRWEWDAWARFGAIPDSELKINPGKFKQDSGMDYARTRSFSKIMASIPPEAREKAFAGEPLRLTVKDLPPAAAGALMDMYNNWCQSWQVEQMNMGMQHTEHQRNVMIRPYTDKEIRQASIEISVSTGDRPGWSQRLDGPCGSIVNPISTSPDNWVREYAGDLPKAPQYPSASDYKRTTDLHEVGWNEPAGDQHKIKPEKPRDKQQLVFADLLAAVSKASGYSIVCEDFASHKVRWMEELAPLFDKESSLKHVLTACMNNAQVKWLIDEKSKLLVGSAQSWADHHNNLVPASLIDDLRAKMNGDGVELDGAVPILRLSSEQLSEWFDGSSELDGLRWSVLPCEKPFWLLYDSLTLQEKNLAKSASGLPLSKYDPQYLSEIFAAAGKAFDEQKPEEKMESALRAHPELQADIKEGILKRHPNLSDMSASEVREVNIRQLSIDILKELPEYKGETLFPTDPEVISKLALRISRYNTQPFARIFDAKGGWRREYRTDGFQKHRYSMSITGEGISLSISGPILEFPIYSAKREAKLWEEKQKAAHK